VEVGALPDPLVGKIEDLVARIDRHDVQPDAVAGGPGDERLRDVGGTRSHVQETHGFATAHDPPHAVMSVEPRDERHQRSPRECNPSQPPVDSLEVTQVAGKDLAVERSVEQFLRMGEPLHEGKGSRPGPIAAT